jgi:mannose-6-phosphate isomerase
MDIQNKILELKGKVQHYAWGGFEFIPSLLHIANTGHKPYAEYWMGTHPLAPSEIVDGNENIPLDQLIKQKPLDVLGEKVFNQFHELPYLLKVLDVKEMLSIQVHPSKEEAAKGFDAEEAAGIPINAANRNYKDRNHKPEVMLAISDFWLLHGFKTKAAIEKTLNDVREFSPLVTLFRTEGYKGLYRLLMEMEQQQVDYLLEPLVKRELRRKRDNELTRQQPGWWVSKLYEEGQPIKNIDRGIFSIYFFNIVHLKKGEAIFQDAGVPHAYLEGQNVELMANSDNVLRGGLTPKHIDVPELMKHTLFEAVVPAILKGEGIGNEKFYPCPVDDFGISSIELKEGEKYSAIARSLEILLVMEGAVIVKGKEHKVVKKGEALAAMDGCEYSITSSGRTMLFKAFVP